MRLGTGGERHLNEDAGNVPSKRTGRAPLPRHRCCPSLTSAPTKDTGEVGLHGAGLEDEAFDQYAIQCFDTDILFKKTNFLVLVGVLLDLCVCFCSYTTLKTLHLNTPSRTRKQTHKIHVNLQCSVPCLSRRSRLAPLDPEGSVCSCSL